VIEKLWQLGVIDSASDVIQWALQELTKKGENLKIQSDIEIKLIRLLAERTIELSDFYLTLFI
jgi:hypothetical protein